MTKRIQFFFISLLFLIFLGCERVPNQKAENNLIVNGKSLITFQNEYFSFKYLDNIKVDVVLKEFPTPLPKGLGEETVVIDAQEMGDIMATFLTKENFKIPSSQMFFEDFNKRQWLITILENHSLHPDSYYFSNIARSFKFQQEYFEKTKRNLIEKYDLIEKREWNLEWNKDWVSARIEKITQIDPNQYNLLGRVNTN